MSDLEKPPVKKRTNRRARRKKQQLGFLPGMDQPARKKQTVNKVKLQNDRRKEKMKLAGKVKASYSVDKEAIEGIREAKEGEDLTNLDDAANFLLKLGRVKYAEMSNK